MEAHKVQDASVTPGLLAEQARALVNTEEARFAASQSRATALLAVAGVIAGLGGGVLTGLDGRDFKVPVNLIGTDISAVLVAACLTGAVAIVSLLRSGATAMGALQEKPDPHPQKLIPLVKSQFPDLLEQGPVQSSRVLLALLAGQLEVVQAAAAEVNDAVRQSARLLGIAVAAGLVLSVLILFGTAAQEQRVLLVDEGNKSQSTRSPR